MNASKLRPLLFTRQEMLDLISAVESAADDADYYFEHGGADEDYVGDEESPVEYKAKAARWGDLHTMLTREVYGH